uniref:Uncharacterized protein n=1 Tax=Megaselia scalaris TaxID=36166 RepID=T1GAA5_MEGSC
MQQTRQPSEIFGLVHFPPRFVILSLYEVLSSIFCKHFFITNEAIVGNSGLCHGYKPSGSRLSKQEAEKLSRK